MVLLDQQQSLQVGDWFPGVIALGVSHPLYEILQLFLASMTSVALDGLDLVLFVIVDEVRWGPRELFTMFNCLNVWG